MTFLLNTSSTAFHYADELNSSTVFPPLQAFPWPSYHNKQSSDINNTLTVHSTALPKLNNHTTNTNIFKKVNCYTTSTLAPPKYPSYLKHTNYSNLALEQYNYYNALQTNSNITKHPSNNDIKDIDLRLPQYWNKNDKDKYIQVGLNGFETSCVVVRPGNNDRGINTTAGGLIRTNFPSRPQCGVYYFEVKVQSNGQDALFAIGFCTATTKLDRLPGCDAASYSFGYHAQQGRLYAQCRNIEFGPTYYSGDIIGCGVNFASAEAFYTKNGVFVGTTLIDTCIPLYPCVGLSTFGEKTYTNFGQEPFLFDINQYVKEQQLHCLQSTTHSTSNKNEQQMDAKDMYKNNTKEEMNQLVVSFLIQQGHLHTAAALLKNMDYVDNNITPATATTFDLSAQNRTQIRNHILEGNVDFGIDQTRQLYPGLLESNDDLLFQLKTRKFLDFFMDTPANHYRNNDTDDETTSSYSGKSVSSVQTQTLYDDEEAHAFTSTPPAVAPGRRLSWAAIAASPTSPTVDVPPAPLHRHHSKPGRRRLSSCSSISFENIDEETASESSSTICMDTIAKAMQYSQQLEDEYDHSPKYLNKLMDLFTILGYSNIQKSPCAHLLTVAQRDCVASELNNAILAYEGNVPDSNLERIYKQSMAVNKELALAGHGKASLINLDCFCAHY